MPLLLTVLKACILSALLHTPKDTTRPCTSKLLVVMDDIPQKSNGTFTTGFFVRDTLQKMTVRLNGTSYPKEGDSVNVNYCDSTILFKSTKYKILYIQYLK